MGGGSGDHMDKLGLIGGGHDHKTGQIGEKGGVEGPRVGGAVCTHKPRTVDGEPHRQALNRHIMHHLIVAALQKGGIERAKGFEPPRRQTG